MKIHKLCCSARPGRRGDYFEIKPENMFEMIRPD